MTAASAITITIAQQGDRRAEAGGRAVEAADDRQLDVEQVPDDLLGLAAQGVGAARRAQRREPRHVAAGRERPPGAGEHDRPRLPLRLQRAEQLAEVVVQAPVDGVDRRVGVVDGGDQHVAVALAAGSSPRRERP